MVWEQKLLFQVRSIVNPVNQTTFPIKTKPIKMKKGKVQFQFTKTDKSKERNLVHCYENKIQFLKILFKIFTTMPDRVFIFPDK